MAEITFKGTTVHTVGSLPEVGSGAINTLLCNSKLEDVPASSFGGRVIILNVFPSIDTGICAQSVRTFNERAASLSNAIVLNVSNDLPFALNRFCGAEGIENVEVLSAFRSDFGELWGLTMTDGPLAGLLARAIIVVDDGGAIVHTELVPEIAQEPDYDAAIAAIPSV